MRRRRYCSRSIVSVVLLSAVGMVQARAADLTTKESSNDSPNLSEAAALVKQALLAEAAGDDEARSSYLRRAPRY